MSPGPQKQFDRDEVLECAMQRFWTDGYDGTGMAQLVDCMGIGRQSLYDTFGGKRQLFAEALEHYFRTRIGPVIRELRAPGEPTANLRRVFAMWIDLAAEEGARGCMVGKALADLGQQDDGIRNIVGGFVAATQEAFVDLFQRGQATGEFTREIPPQDLGTLFVSVSQGAALIGRLELDPDKAPRLLENLLRLVRPADAAGTVPAATSSDAASEAKKSESAVDAADPERLSHVPTR